MLRLSSRFASVILAFAPLFLQRSWRHAEVLLIGAILAPGQRTVTSILRITGLARERRFVNYHRVLSRAAWCPRVASRVLLGLLVAAFAPKGVARQSGWLPYCLTQKCSRQIDACLTSLLPLHHASAPVAAST